ncbi:MAG: hypothetical protein METHAR1v1_970007 [Methanothrix sp.]|nr:MAG: hypothetical protein METHAR1v1_970007 [Methanothrix sp.]
MVFSLVLSWMIPPNLGAGELGEELIKEDNIMIYGDRYVRRDIDRDRRVGSQRPGGEKGY